MIRPVSATRPKNAPYEITEIGEPVEVRVFERDGSLIAECDFRGDLFGGQIDLPSMPTDALQRAVRVDELVDGIALLVWHELLGSPVFREEDDEYVARVSARARWEEQDRKPTQGWVVGPGVPKPTVLPETVEPVEEISDRIGDADVSSLKLSQEEMTSLMHGEIPESVMESLLRARSTLNLLESVALALDAVEQDSFNEMTVRRAKQELDEVRRRFLRE